LSGALAGTGEHGQSSSARRRPAGVIVAVNVNHSAGDNVVQTLRMHGAKDVEKADGEWRDGQWVDFNPVSAPKLVSDNGLYSSERVVNFMVYQDAVDRWCVYETGYAEPLSEFQTKIDAVKYAIALAQTKSRALVQVYNDEGNIEETIDPTAD